VARGSVLPNQVLPAPDEPAWSQPWLLCTNNGSGTDCQGAISKANWLTDRAGSCKFIANQSNSDQAVVDLTVCQLDATLDRLCRTIQNARYRLFEANCQVTGACRTTAFFYQPATYSISNDQFVRQTVQYFYNFTVNGACPVYDAELAAIISQNQRTAQDCAAQSLEVMQFAIQAAREVIHFFVSLCYYSGQIGMQLLALIMTTDPNPIIHQIMFYLTQILAQFRQFFSTLGDLMYKMIMETGKLGQFIRDMVFAICNFLHEIFQIIIQPFICFLKEVIMGILDAFEKLLDGITMVFGGLSDFRDSVQNTRNDLDEKFKCDVGNPFNCTSLFDDDDSMPSSLPMPTRCWVGYQPAVGDQHGLGCAASDTCMDDDGSLKACAACSGDVGMDRFGCDSLTKLCRCHTFPVGQTQCSSHMECLLPDTECGFVDAYLKPSFGNIPCAQCSSQAQCLVTGLGQCVCLLRPTPNQICPSTYRSQRVSPDPTKLCLLSMGLSVSTSSSYSANWQDLASTPCAQIGQTWCLAVWWNSANLYMVVGLSLLSGRRLLGDGGHEPNMSIWEAAHEPCRSLMQAKLDSILERHTASECERWRLIGERAVLHFNLSADPVQFTSYLGIADVDGLSLRVLVFLARHADLAQPMLVVGRRIWHHVLPTLNASKLLFNRIAQRFATIPASDVALHTVQDLLPWFAKRPTVQPNATANVTFHSRRLLDWKDRLQAVQTFSVDIANGNIANLAPNIAASWSQGPFTWPPDYDYAEKHTCLAASIAWNITSLAIQSTVAYYTHTGPPRPVVANTFAEALPRFPSWTPPPAANEPQLISFFRAQLKALMGIDLSVIKQYTTATLTAPSQLSQDLSGFMHCDFVKLQHCTGHRRSIWWGGIIVFGFFMGLSLFGRFLGIPFFDHLLILLYAPVTMVFVYEYSIFCFPLVPTCLSSDLLEVIQNLMPSHISWPDQLQRWPGCVDGSPSPDSTSIIPGTKACFVPCTSAPFYYQSWEDSAAWIACELGWCSSAPITEQWQPFVDTLPAWAHDSVRLDRLVDALNRKKPFMGWQDMKNAQRVCFLFTCFNLVPALVFSVLLVAAALAAVAVAVALVQLVLSCLLIVFTFAHCR